MAATFIFYLREDRPDRRGYCPVYLKITHNRKRKYVNTGIRLLPSDWNDEKQIVRRSHDTYRKLNDDLQILREKAQQSYRELNRDGKANADSVKKRLQNSSKLNFFDITEEYLKELKANKKYWSRKQAKVAFDKVKKFNGSDQLPLNSIDTDFMEKFQAHLNLENKASTIHKNLGAIRAVLDKACKAHLISENPLRNDDFNMVKDNGAKPKTKLTAYQIGKIENLDLKANTNIWHSRNAFILAFYFCGMRFGDVASLKWKNVKNGRLVYQMNKTGNPINVKIPEKAKIILNLYHIENSESDDFILPFLSKLSSEELQDVMTVKQKISSWNALVNSLLKDIAKLAEIDETISMHVARHSFAQYGMEKGISIYKMMMLLGHQNIKTTQQYLKTIDVKLVDETIDEIF